MADKELEQKAKEYAEKVHDRPSHREYFEKYHKKRISLAYKDGYEQGYKLGESVANGAIKSLQKANEELSEENEYLKEDCEIAKETLDELKEIKSFLAEMMKTDAYFTYEKKCDEIINKYYDGNISEWEKWADKLGGVERF